MHRWLRVSALRRAAQRLLAPSSSINSRSGSESSCLALLEHRAEPRLHLLSRHQRARGAQLGEEFRYLEPTYFGGIRFDMNPSDPKTNSSRYFFDIHTIRSPTLGHWGQLAAARRLSGRQLLHRHSRSILNSSRRVLPARVQRIRALGSDWSVLFSVTWQAILDARPGPYERVPQLQFRNVLRDVRGFDVDTVLGAANSRAAAARSRMAAGRRSAGQLPDRCGPGWSIVAQDVGAREQRQARRFGRVAVVEQPGAADLVDRLGHGVRAAGALLRARRHANASSRGCSTSGPRTATSRSCLSSTRRSRTSTSRSCSPRTPSSATTGSPAINQLTAAAVSRVIEPSTAPSASASRSASESTSRSGASRFPSCRAPTSAPGRAAGGRRRPRTGHELRHGLQYSVRDGDIPRFSALWRHLPPDGPHPQPGRALPARPELGQLDTSWRCRWRRAGRCSGA
ncbi:MAG: hypothetical protein R3E41_08625 [Burkholderiaceae bacterium]